MSYMSDTKFQAELKKAKRKNLSKERKRLLKNERRKHWPKMKKPSTGKIALWAGFFMMLEVIIFCQYLALKTYDAAPLVGVVSAIGGWMSMFFSYNKKSSIENSKDGIIYETAMAALSQASSESTGAVG